MDNRAIPKAFLKELSPVQKESIVPTRTINNPFRIAKQATNGNHRLSKMSKIETTSKASLKLPSKIWKTGRVLAGLLTLDTAHNPPAPLPPQP